MAATNIGLGHVTGLVGTDDFFGSAVLYQGAEDTHDFDKKYTKDSLGETKGGFGFNASRKIRIDMICAASTIAAAEAGLKRPGVLAKVVLSTFKDATLNANWIYEGGCVIKYMNDDVAKITLPLIKFTTDISTPVTA